MRSIETRRGFVPRDRGGYFGLRVPRSLFAPPPVVNAVKRYHKSDVKHEFSRVRRNSVTTAAVNLINTAVVIKTPV